MMTPKFWNAFVLTFSLIGFVNATGILYPRESESREVKSLDGIWSFLLDRHEDGFQGKWYEQPLDRFGDIELMPVPSSYNDVTQKVEIRDHIGWVWYQTTFWIPSSWELNQQNIFLRFGSANYFSVVWVNGQHVMNHTGGHLPFNGEISQLVNFGGQNLVVVAINNTLTPLTLPQGTLTYPNDPTRYPENFTIQGYNFDYFHFAGIHRPVYVYTTPRTYIDDISVTTTFSNGDQLLGGVDFSVDFVSESMGSIDCQLVIRDKQDNLINTTRGCQGHMDIVGVKLWWPHTHEPVGEIPGYLYNLQVTLTDTDFPEMQDVYRLKFGVRTIEYGNTSFMINGEPFYFRGFGRHEDYAIRGRGVDNVMIVKDHNLLKWIGANSYRTSHYPYAEEILDLADELGFVIIDESPAIGLSGFGDELLASHIQVMRELVQRDKNRASVVMWAIGNEPLSLQAAAPAYFQQVIAETKSADPGVRPCTIVLSQGFPDDKGPEGLDVISINRYFGWYQDTGRLEVIHLQMPTEARKWFSQYNKPVLVAEYGAGTVAGMHMSPSFVWTEDYQSDFHREYFKAFDQLRAEETFFIGEMIWNFADFATPQEYFRPWGCMKGVFTRERQPKQAAYIVRKRYWALANRTWSSHC